jgi:AraC-like DNA-binding protein
MLTLGVSTFFAPTKVEKRHSVILFWILGAYTILLAINYLLVPRSLQLIGIYIACALLFILNCLTTYMGYAVYRKTINDLRTYFSDVLADLMRWMLGIGLSTLLFLISAPIVCLCPKIVGIYQLALGIIVIIYAFVSIVNFSFRYNTVATAFNTGKEEASQVVEAYSSNDGASQQQHSSLSASLQEVMQDKELRWQRKGGYRTSGITIEQAAHDMGTNRSYLSRYLNEVRHMTFYEWVAQMRIHEAQQIMLQNPDATIEQIAGQVGFTAASTFSTTFKKIVGISPAKWRSRQ